MKKLFTTLLIIVILSSTLFSQSGIKFNKKVHDFGVSLNSSQPPAVFEFTNTSDKPLAILLVKSSYTVMVNYKKVFIKPGEKGQIYIKDNNNKLGPYEEEIEIITNLSREPEYLVIKGTNASVQECFPDKSNMEKRKVIVIDSETKQPVPAVDLVFTHNFKNISKGKTNKKGELIKALKIGNYSIDLKAYGYYDKTENLFVNKSRPLIYLEIDPIKKVVEEVAEVEEEVNVIENKNTEDEVIEEKPVIESEMLPESIFAANNIILIVDVSLSMKTYKKLDLLKVSLNNLILNLREIDKVSLIAYSTYAYPKLIGVKGNNKDTLINAVNKLKPSGITNGVKGLDKGYEEAINNFIPNGNNQIILATDGEFTGSEDSEENIKKMIEEYAEKGVILSIIGFGVDDDAKARMNNMAKYGKGKYIHINHEEDATDTLLNEIKENSRKK